MKPNAILYLAIPDKDYTFDKSRTLTPNKHLWQEYLDNIQELSVEHLNDFLLNITKNHIEPERRARMYFKNDRLPMNWFTKRRIYHLHRERSIHVHVWNQNTFDNFLRFAIERLSLQFAIIDKCCSSETSNHEMIYIIKKTG